MANVTPSPGTLSWGTTRPDVPTLVDRLHVFVQEAGLQPDPDVEPWNSGIDAILDGVDRAQARYASADRSA